MKQEMSNHLSEEALDDILIGLGSVESKRHLTLCPECRARVELFESNISLFNQAATAWAEDQPRISLRPVAELPRRHVSYNLIGSLAAAILGVAVLIPVWRHQHQDSAADQGKHTLRMEDSEAQIAQDNQFMEAVSEAINAPEESPVEEYGITARPIAHIKAQPK